MGTGIQDMMNRCIDYGLPEPEFTMRDGFVTTVYRKKGIAFEKVKDEDIVETVIKNTEKVGEKVGEKLTENQQRILSSITANPYIAAPELAAIIGISKRKIEENFAKLKAKGLIERIGPDKGGYWRIVATE